MARWFCVLLLILPSLLLSYADADADEVIPETPRLLSASLSPNGTFSCTPEVGQIRKGGTYNVPLDTLTESAEECCRLCFDDPLCKTWTRQRSTGACALMDVVPPLRPSLDHDSGLLFGTDALEAILKPDCVIEKRMSYPEGLVIKKLKTRNARSCCRLCIDNLLCFSWYYARGTNYCVLNANVPKGVEQEGHKGYSLI